MSYKRKENYEASMLGIVVSLLLAAVILLAIGIIKLIQLESLN
jgi:hypothetical protein